MIGRGQHNVYPEFEASFYDPESQQYSFDKYRTDRRFAAKPFFWTEQKSS